MATEVDVTETANSAQYIWLTGIIAGLASALVTGLVIQLGFDPAILSESIPAGFGASGLAAGWLIFLGIGGVLGLAYAAVARIERIRPYAIYPRTGTYVGLAFGVAIWVLAMIVVPLWVGDGVGGIGAYAVNLQGVLSFALLGIIIGLIYGVSPYTE